MEQIKHPKAVFSRIGFCLLAYLLSVNISATVISIFTERFLPELYSSPYFIWILNVVAQYIIGIPIAALCLIGIPVYRYKKEKMKATDFGVAFCMFAFVAQAGSIIGNILNFIISGVTGVAIENPVDEMMTNSDIWIVFVVVALLGPVMEELLFRRWFIDRLRPYGEATAIIFTGVLFGVFHGNFYQAFYATGIGILLGFIYVRSKNFLYPVLLHVLFNLVFGVIPVFLMPSEDILNNMQNITILDTLRMLAASGYSLLTLAVAGLGLIFFIFFRKRFFVLKNYYNIQKGQVFKTTCLNAGVIIFAIFILIEFIINMFGPSIIEAIQQNLPTT